MYEIWLTFQCEILINLDLFIFYFFPFSLKKNHSKGKIEPHYPRLVRLFKHAMIFYFFLSFSSSPLSLLTPCLTQPSSPPLTSAPLPRPPAVEPLHVPRASCTASVRERRWNEVRCGPGRRHLLGPAGGRCRKMMIYTFITFWYRVIVFFPPRFFLYSLLMQLP